jgi:hypothetical protein
MYAQLFAQFRLRFSADHAGEPVALPRFLALLLPGAMHPAALGKWALFVIPVLLGIAGVESLKPFAYFLACFLSAFLSAPMRELFLASELPTAFSGARTALMSMARLYEVYGSAALAGFFDMILLAFPRAESSARSCHYDTEGFSAALAGFFDLLLSTFKEASAAAILLIGLDGPDVEDVFAHGALSSSHMSIIA